MAMFATGNPGWDQGLNTLAGSLFPDPSKQAQAGYYGAETANALIKGYQTRDQMGQQRYLQDLMARGGTGPTPIPGPAAPPGPDAPPGLVIPYTSPQTAPPAPTPSLAATVVPGQPNMGGPIPPIPGNPATPPFAATPGGPGPAAAPAPPVPPGAGTNGQPMPPDPSLSTGPMHPGTFQPQGGGVKQAPPAASNGSPAPLMVNLPYLMATAARAGMDPNVVKLLGTSWINGQIQSGAMDKETGYRFLSGAGDTGPLNAATQITTTGMNNATTLEQTRIQGANQVANTREQGAQTRETNDNELMSVVPVGQNVPVSRTKGYIKAHPQEFTAYDSARAAAGDVPAVVSGTPGSTTAPPVYTQTRNLPGQTPYDQKQADADRAIVTVITPAGRRMSMTYGNYRQNPSVGRLENATDQGTTTVMKNGLPAVTSTGEATATGAQPVPTGTDQLNATNAAGVTQRVLTDPQSAPALTEAVRAGQENIQPRTALTPDQELRISSMVDQTVQQMYPVPSGTHLSRSTAPRALDATLKAEVISRVRDLAATAKYRNDPAAAVPAVLQQMQAEGVLPKNVDSSIGYLSWSDPNLTGSGKDARYIVHRAPTVADTVTRSMPGGGGAPAQTAPAQTAPTPDTGPPVVAGTAATSAVTPAPGRGVAGTLADIVAAPGRLVGGRMTHRPGVMTGKQAPTAAPVPGGPLNRAITPLDIAGAGGGSARVPLPPGALAPAPPGAVEGQTGTAPDGKTRAIVRGGFMFPLTAAAGAGTGGGGG